MPCLEPVLIIALGFSWWSMKGTKVCCTLTTLSDHVSNDKRHIVTAAHLPPKIDVEYLIPGF